MSDIERMTIFLPSEIAAMVDGAVEGGEYASSSEVVHEALRDWETKRAIQLRKFADLKTEIHRGLDDLAQGRVKEFDKDRIIERGRAIFAGRSRSA